MRFIVFLVRFAEKKKPKTANSRQCRGSFTVAKRPLAAEKDPHTTARSRRRIFPSSGSWRRRASPRRSTVHSMEMLCFCFVLFCFSVVLKTCLLD